MSSAGIRRGPSAPCDGSADQKPACSADPGVGEGWGPWSLVRGKTANSSADILDHQQIPERAQGSEQKRLRGKITPPPTGELSKAERLWG